MIQGTTIELRIAVRDTDGNLSDPQDVQVYAQWPSGNVTKTVTGGGVTRDDVGEYRATIDTTPQGDCDWTIEVATLGVPQVREKRRVRVEAKIGP